jgi:hypothetical protein
MKSCGVGGLLYMLWNILISLSVVNVELIPARLPRGLLWWCGLNSSLELDLYIKPVRHH